MVQTLSYLMSSQAREAGRALMGCRGNSGYYFDFKIKTRQPVHADRRPVRIGGLREGFTFYRHNGGELVFRIGVKTGDINDVIKATACCSENRAQVVEGEPDLAFKVGLWRTSWRSVTLAQSECLPGCYPTNHRGDGGERYFKTG